MEKYDIVAVDSYFTDVTEYTLSDGSLLTVDTDNNTVTIQRISE